MVRPLVALAYAVSVLLLAGCGGSQSGEAAQEDPEPQAVEQAETPGTDEAAGKGHSKDHQGDAGAAAVPETLRFTGTTVSGDSFEGASLAEKPTLLWFWAPWCPTCRGQIPQVEGLAADHGDELNVVGIGSLDSAEAIAGFADDVDGITHLEDAEGSLWKRFGVTEQSSFVLLDSDGSVVFEAGYGGSEELGARVDAVLG